MNKAMLVDAIAKIAKTPKANAKRIVEAFMDVVTAVLRKNGQVTLTGFGTFSVMKRKARMGVNPATGKKMPIPAKKVPKFKPGKELKTVVATK